jgi:putative ABC transport system ATP-binding protein
LESLTRRKKAATLACAWDFRMPPLVQTVGISKDYPSGGTVIGAVSDVSISIERGEFVAIRGRSGSGKSTLLNLVGLLERPDRGQYALNGRAVAKLSEDSRATIRNQDIGFIFQLPALLPRATALENVELPLVYSGVRRLEDAAEPRKRSTGSDWPTAPITGQISSPGESSSGSLLPAQW